MKALRAAGKLLRGLLHLLAGFWTVSLRFRRMPPSHREAYVQAWSQQLLALWGVQLQVRGTPPHAGPVLLVANHISWLDILVMHAARYCRFVSKADVRHWPVIGVLAAGAGTLFIERASSRDALRVVHHMAEALQQGEVVAVFPEGTTGDGVHLLTFHANLLQAAVTTGAPVVPVALSFLDAATRQRSAAPSFVGDETLLGSVWRTLTAPGIIAVVSFGEPQWADGRSRRIWSRDLREAVERLREANSALSVARKL